MDKWCYKCSQYHPDSQPKEECSAPVVADKLPAGLDLGWWMEDMSRQIGQCQPPVVKAQ